MGHQLLIQLGKSRHYSAVHNYTRRKIGPKHDKIKNFRIDFSKLGDELKNIRGDDLYIALGTTIKKAGSKEKFAEIDRDYVLEIARFGLKNGVNQLLLVTAVGADPNSLFFYNRVKGQIEEEVCKLNYWATHLFRPSILLGNRKEERFLEGVAASVGKGLSKLGDGLLGKYQPVEASVLASRMIEASCVLKPGVYIYESGEINRAATKSVM